jgi:hypothetical protein
MRVRKQRKQYMLLLCMCTTIQNTTSWFEAAVGVVGMCSIHYLAHVKAGIPVVGYMRFHSGALAMHHFVVVQDCGCCCGCVAVSV